MLDIIDLNHRKDLIEIVAHWTWQEWGTENNYLFFKDLVQYSLNENSISQTFVALLDGEPVGTVSLIKNDLKSRQDLSPWLASLYIVEEFRHLGLGLKLQNFVIDRAELLGYKELYLFTKLFGYYEKNEWIFFDEGHSYFGDKVRIYKKVII